ncbi:MAG TPA: ArgE/DapE family deacylase [Pyrinomonadaceae bacterium]|jgi:acetylornithine deacetylase|nr:ArgE/DapE family deacylase [Pyrinomonadaceae bacterium]
MSDTINFLRELIAIDSVNPSLVAGAAGEENVALAVAAHMRESGMDVVVEDVAPGRQNVVGVLEGRSAGRSLMLCGHSDTVGVEGMDSPFDPIERDGRIFGRGSGDMKGGVAAMLAAARTLASEGWDKGRLLVAAVVDEEYMSIGAEALVKSWSADAAVITEPTGLKVAIGHKGFSWIEIVTEGRAAHGSRPAEGRDAIMRMGRVLERLEELTRKLQARSPHPVLGQASLHASIINGGRELSTYPESCVLQLERRNVSGEAPDIAIREVEEILDSLRREDREFVASARLMFDRAPYETPAEHDLPRRLETAVKHIGHDTCREGMTYWTDAAILGQAGIPTVVFGPGGEGFHAREEFVFVDHVEACRDALVLTARDFCGNESHIFDR